MTNNNPWPTQDVLERAVEMALEIDEAMGAFPSGRERGAFVRKLFNAAELVWAVWRDPDEQDVFHFEIVKGAASVGSLATTAFLVPDGATAEKMRAGLGDGAIAPIAHHSKDNPMNTALPTIENDADILQWVRAISHENGERLRAMSYRKQRAYVRRSIKTHDVVWLAWEDDDHFHCHCIKGRGRLGELTTTAFYVANRMDAIAIAEEWGAGWPDLHEMPARVM